MAPKICVFLSSLQRGEGEPPLSPPSDAGIVAAHQTAPDSRDFLCFVRMFEKMGKRYVGI